MKHLFVIDPIDTQTLELNSSVKLAYALHADGSKVWFTSIRALTVATAASCPVCECRAITFTDADFRSICIDPASEIRPLNYFAAVHMRKDPPFDLQYLTATHILDHVDVPVFNSPVALRNLNEKISILHFPAASIPALVSA
ncbi:MAG: hypothetical protein OYH77_04810, partial [Pseudomonadota bacterium]|nr:hypothetical protein [Pseudomonadota bacterium]